MFSPLAYSSPGNAVATTLFGELLKDELNEFSYAADIAGLKYSILNNSDGLKVHIFPLLACFEEQSR